MWDPIGCVIHYTDDGKLGGSGDRNTNSASSKEELGGNSTDSLSATPTCALYHIRTVSIAPPTLTSQEASKGVNQSHVSQALLRKPKQMRPQAPRSDRARQRITPFSGWIMVAPTKAAGCPSHVNPVPASKGSKNTAERGISPHSKCFETPVQVKKAEARKGKRLGPSRRPPDRPSRPHTS